MGWGRVAWRLQRFELVVLIGGCLALAAAMAFAAWQVDTAQADLRACYQEAPDSDVPGWPCRPIDERLDALGTAASILTGVGIVAPFVVGVLLGTPLLAREIEHRTAPLAWSMSRSRHRWLAGRLLPVLAAVVIALLVLGAASEALLLGMRDGPLGYADFGYHGPLLAVRGVTVLLIGVLVGLVIGRVLPAILVTGLLTIALLLGLYIVRDQFMRAEAIWMPVGADGGNFSMIYDQAWTDDATGALVTYDEATQRFPEVFGPEGSWDPSGLTMVYLATPPELYPDFVARESAALGGVAVVAAAGAAWLVGWRRPD